MLFVATVGPAEIGALAGVCLLVFAGCAAWDLVVLGGLAIDALRRRRGQRPIRVGVDYGAGGDTWFETTAGPEPYRSCDQRRLVAHGEPGAAARRIGRALAIRLAVVLGGMTVATLAVEACHPVDCCHICHVKTACNTVRQAAMSWKSLHPEDECPTPFELKAEGALDTGFSLRDPWGGYYDLRCDGAEITCSSPGPDRKRGTDDDVVVPQGERATTP
jgi:hypothetical protein